MKKNLIAAFTMSLFTIKATAQLRQPIPGTTDTATTYFMAFQHQQQSKTAIIVCPGGGYSHVAIQHEGIDVATWMNEMGIDAFVIRYSVTNKEGANYYPTQLNEVKRLAAYVKAKGYERIGVMGFSAGGHLAGSYLTDPEQFAQFGMLIYPVISSDSSIRHSGSFKNLTGDTILQSSYPHLSIDQRVSNKTPPLFLAHTKDDRTVPYQNSTVLFEKIVAIQPESVLHIYEKGGHGFGMRPISTDAKAWKTALEKWLARQLL